MTGRAGSDGGRAGSGAGRDNTVAATAEAPERAYLIAVDTGGDAGWSAEESLGELAALVEAAGGDVVGSAVQRRETIHPLWYLGKGKAEELKPAKGQTQFTMLVADDELSPKQQRSLEELLNVKVLDRSGIILDIFAQRAHTHEGRIQVELAQLEYQLPRLTRMWTHLSRMGGGIGTRRGPGETQLETDRRVIRERIKKTRERVEEVRQRRATAARARERRLLPTMAIVGYTNAGKSTLLNALVGEEAAAVEDMVFATLDPTMRAIRLPGIDKAILSDTVGFISDLPTHLVAAFLDRRGDGGGAVVGRRFPAPAEQVEVLLLGLLAQFDGLGPGGRRGPAIVLEQLCRVPDGIDRHHVVECDELVAEGAGLFNATNQRISDRRAVEVRCVEDAVHFLELVDDG